MRSINARLQHENELLRQKVDLLIRRVFGRSSEAFNEAQLDLFMMGENLPKKDSASWVEEAATQHREQKAKKPNSPRRSARWPEDLPTVEEVIEPAEVEANPADWRRIGEERTERLDYQPAQFFRQVTVRPKYVERDLPEAAPVIAELPSSLQERCMAGPGLIAQVVVGKYCDHLPLYRQEQIFKQRHNIWLPRQTLADWVELAAFWMHPIYEKIKAQTFETGCAQVDEPKRSGDRLPKAARRVSEANQTPVKYLSPGLGKRGKVTFGPSVVRAKASSSTGKPAGVRTVWKISFR